MASDVTRTRTRFAFTPPYGINKSLSSSCGSLKARIVMSTISSTISSYRKRCDHDGRSASRRSESPDGARVHHDVYASSNKTPEAWSGQARALDSSVCGALSVERKAPRASEKAQVRALNERFGCYIEKVRLLEQKNGALRAELERCRGTGPARLAELCAHELSELRRHVDRLTNEKARAEVQRDNLLADLKRIRAKCVQINNNNNTNLSLS